MSRHRCFKTIQICLKNGKATRPRHLPGIKATPACRVIRIIRIIRSYGHTVAAWHFGRAARYRSLPASKPGRATCPVSKPSPPKVGIPPRKNVSPVLPWGKDWNSDFALPPRSEFRLRSGGRGQPEIFERRAQVGHKCLADQDPDI